MPCRQVPLPCPLITYHLPCHLEILLNCFHVFIPIHPYRSVQNQSSTRSITNQNSGIPCRNNKMPLHECRNKDADQLSSTQKQMQNKRCRNIKTKDTRTYRFPFHRSSSMPCVVGGFVLVSPLLTDRQVQGVDLPSAPSLRPRATRPIDDVIVVAVVAVGAILVHCLATG